jgi:phage-related protein
MAGKMGKAVIDVEGDFSPIQKQAQGESQKLGSNMGSTIKKAVLAVGGVLAVGAIIDKTKEAIGAASDLSESVNVTGLVFGDAAKGMDSFFASSAQQMGMSESVARQASSNIGSLLGNLGFSADDAAKSTQALMQRAADLGSAFNAEPADVVQALGAALRGETEPARRFGIMLNDASIKAEAMAMGLYDGKGAIDDNAKAQAAMSLVMKQSDKVAGDFVNTSDGLANSQRIVAATAEDLKAQFGMALMPAVEGVMGAFKELMPALQPVIKAIGGELGEVLSHLVPVIAKLLPVVMDLVGVLGESLAMVVEDLAPPFMDLLAALAPLISVVAKLAQTILSSLLAALAPLLETIGPLVKILADALAPVLVSLAPSFQLLGRNLAQILTPLEPLLLSLGELVAALMPLLPPIIQLNTMALPILAPLLVLVAKILSATLTPAIKFLTDVINGLVPTIMSFLNIFTDIPALSAGVIKWFQTLPSVIASALSALPGLLANVARAAISGFLNALTAAWGAVTGFVASIPGRITGALATLASVLSTSGRQAMTGLLDGIVAGWGAVTSWVGGIPSRIVSAVGNMGNTLYAAGKAVMNGLKQGIMDGFGDIASNVSGFAGKIASLKGPLDYDRRLLIPHGNALMAGLAEGLTGGFSDVQTLVSAMGPQLESGMGVALNPVVGAVNVGAAAPVDARLVLNAPVYGLSELDQWADQRDRQLMLSLSARGR